MYTRFANYPDIHKIGLSIDHQRFEIRFKKIFLFLSCKLMNALKIVKCTCVAILLLNINDLLIFAFIAWYDFRKSRTINFSIARDKY